MRLPIVRGEVHRGERQGEVLRAGQGAPVGRCVVVKGARGDGERSLTLEIPRSTLIQQNQSVKGATFDLGHGEEKK